MGIYDQSTSISHAHAPPSPTKSSSKKPKTFYYSVAKCFDAARVVCWPKLHFIFHISLTYTTWVIERCYGYTTVTIIPRCGPRRTIANTINLFYLPVRLTADLSAWQTSWLHHIKLRRATKLRTPSSLSWWESQEWVKAHLLSMQRAKRGSFGRARNLIRYKNLLSLTKCN